MERIDEQLILLYYLKFMFIFSDIDECISKPCDTNATCENFFGLYNFTCKKGFTGDETTNCSGDLITNNEIIIHYNAIVYIYFSGLQPSKSCMFLSSNYFLCQEYFQMIL